ncbi:hypothetical protein N7471_013415 [Penicillium samsonianum]|uniref:uncharacterized protein n=1 Tax=Penicillium samsonianum TaxID=1882272 RepID=UPI00254688CB|nr:uncharacterized protein N7471_013415 [Penicillium samsonianum]KAJ6118795.1 hypothetical protein N7471_013415 [Penicillium samsonianum]
MKDQVIAIVREIGRQRAINRFHRTCYSLLQELRTKVSIASANLLLVYHSNTAPTPGGYFAAKEMASELEEAVKGVREVEAQALAAWKSILNLERSNSVPSLTYLGDN